MVFTELILIAKGNLMNNFIFTLNEYGTLVTNFGKKLAPTFTTAILSKPS